MYHAFCRAVDLSGLMIRQLERVMNLQMEIGWNESLVNWTRLVGSVTVQDVRWRYVWSPAVCFSCSMQSAVTGPCYCCSGWRPLCKLLLGVTACYRIMCPLRNDVLMHSDARVCLSATA